MTMTLNTNWLNAVTRKGAQLRLLLTVTFNDSTSYKSVDGKCTGVTYPSDIHEVAALSSELNPLTREMQIGGLSITLRAERWKDLIVAKRIKLQQAVIEIGEESLAEADYEPFFSGIIDTAKPSSDYRFVTLELLDIFQALQVKEVYGTWPNSTRSYAPHPLQVLADINTLGQIPSALVDSTSLDPSQAQYATISHLVLARYAQLGASSWATNQAKAGMSGDSMPAMELAAEVAQLINGSYIATEEGKLKFSAYDATAASTFDWTTDQINGIRPIESHAHVVNRVMASWRYFSESRQFHQSYERNDTDSQANFKYPGETERILTHKIESSWMQSHMGALRTQILGGTAAPFDIVVGWNPLLITGSRGAIGSAPSDAQVSATRPMYIRTAWPTEIFKVTAISFNQNKVGELTYVDPATNAQLSAIDMPMEATLTVSAREQFGTVAAPHNAWTIQGQEAGKDNNVYDITLPAMLAENVLARFGDGVDIIEVQTSFSEYDVQVGDVGTITHSDFFSFGKNGLTTSTKWEIIKKEPKPSGPDPSITWTLASMPVVTPTITHVTRTRNEETLVQRSLDAIAGDSTFQKFVASGLGVTQTSGLVGSISAGSAGGAGGARNVMRDAVSHTFPASKDTHVTRDIVTGSLGYHSVANGAAAPSLSPHETLLALVVTGASSIISIVTSGVSTAPLDGARVVASTIGTDQIAAAAITSERIAPAAVTSEGLAPAAVTSRNVADSTLGTNHLISNQTQRGMFSNAQFSIASKRS